MAFKIYTKTGDKGETGLFGGDRLPKYHIRIEAYGTVDELNAHLGLLRDQSESLELKNKLKILQDHLFTLGSMLANSPGKKLPIPGIEKEAVQWLEKEIDEMEESLPPLKNFILPGGHPLVSQCHIARCVCRRAERMSTALNHQEAIDPIILIYLNRLSDYLFVLARKIGLDLGAEENPWTPRKKED